jgi:hypothetical protein
MAYAALSGSIEVMEWVVERGAALGMSACDNAAAVGDLAMLKWLHPAALSLEPFFNLWISSNEWPHRGAEVFEALRVR